MKLKSLLLLSLLSVMALTSCNHKDLVYLDVQKARIIVDYDWRDAPDATPAGMCVFFYSVSTPGTYYRFDFDNIKGGEIDIPEGNYVVITYNNDTELVRFSETDNYDGHTAYTRDGDLLEPLYGNGIKSTTATSDGERVCITPDGLWGSHATDVVISRHGITYKVTRFDDSRADGDDSTTYSDQTITLYPHDMLCHYSYEVRNVENAQNVSKISASLSGMSRTMNLVDETPGSEKVTLPVSGAVDSANDKITGQFLTFGHPATGPSSHKMAFFVVMNDGSKYRIENKDNLDVTSQVDNAPDRRNVHIVIDSLKLPESSAETNGWDVSLDDWGIMNEELKI